MNKKEYKKLGLPNKVFIYFKSIDKEGDIDEDIANYLSNNYGFCVNNFVFNICTNGYEVYNINWDTKE